MRRVIRRNRLFPLFANDINSLFSLCPLLPKAFFGQLGEGARFCPRPKRVEDGPRDQALQRLRQAAHLGEEFIQRGVPHDIGHSLLKDFFER